MRASNQPKKQTGFTRECFVILEQMKRDREVELGGEELAQSTEPVWLPSDPRWAVPEAHYNWRAITIRFGDRCVYCGENVEAGSFELYSPRLRALGHRTCEGSGRWGGVKAQAKPITCEPPGT